MAFYSHYLLDAAVLFGVIAWLKSSAARKRRKGLPLPPGPKPLPLIGNVLDMPRSYMWKKAVEWKKDYGDIVYLENFGKPLIILNSYEAASELFERRSAKYSTRPIYPMIDELEGFIWMLVNMPYNDEWKKRRAPIQKWFDSPDVAKLADAQRRDAIKLLGECLRTPADFYDHVRTSVATTIMDVTYGHEVRSVEDPFVDLVREGVRALTSGGAPGAFLVDLLPWMKHIPEWFPGAGFKTVARLGWQASYDMRVKPYEETRDKYFAGTAKPSMTTVMVDEAMEKNGKLTDYDHEHIAAVTGMVYAAGADTTVSALLTFGLAMVKFPEVQKKAQEEIDRVVGHERLPDWSDRSRLPYLEAIYKEILRWQPVVPLAVPHSIDEDDVYNGYFIPKGSMIAANGWAMTRDPIEYPEPEKFIPERFMPKEGQKVPRDPGKIAYGYGRRVCPGKKSAENSMYINMACILAVFNLTKKHGPDGKIIDPSTEYTSDMVSHPVDFSSVCTLTPRSEKAAALIRQSVDMLQ